MDAGHKGVGVRALRLSAWLVGCAASVLAATPAIAGKATRSVPVSVTVVAGCTINAAPLIWSVLIPTNATIDSTSTIVVRCLPNTPYTIDIDDGLYPQGPAKRRVKHSTLNSFLRYDLFKDPPKSKVWGKGAATNFPGNSGPTGINVLTVYGVLGSTRGFAAGGYRDTLTVTLNF